MSKNKLIDLPCPFCANPALLAVPKKKEGPHAGVCLVRTSGRFWRRDDDTSTREEEVIQLPTWRDGERFIATLPSDYIFTNRFDGAQIRLVGVDSGMLTEAPPPPFANSIVRATGGPGVAWNPEYPLSRHTVYSGVLIEHGSVKVAAHWWPSHGWRVELRTDLASGPAEVRNAELQTALDMLELFRLEARGRPKITESALRRVYASQRPTQEEVAKRLGVTVSGLDKWRKRKGFESWQKVVSHFAPSP